MSKAMMTSLLGSAATAALLVASNPVHADDFIIVMPEHTTAQTEVLGRAAWNVFTDAVAPGDTFSIVDGTNNRRVAHIPVPDDGRYEVVKRKARKFAAELAQMKAFINDTASEGAAPDRLDMLGVLNGIGENRLSREDALHVFVIGLPVQITSDPAWSMIGEDGTVQVPSEAAFAPAGGTTPYDVSGKDGILTHTTVHICKTGDDALSRVEDMALRLTWGQWIGRQGGALVTWASDLSVCAERVRARVIEKLKLPPKVTAEDLPPAMVRPGWSAALGKDGDKPIQPDSFNVFFKADHPRVSGLIVFTGVEYKPEDYPQHYVSSWCYFNSASNRDAVQVRINVGDKKEGKDAVWGNARDNELEAAGVSRSDFELARSSCRFPVEGS